jgi:hypothetical protein
MAKKRKGKVLWLARDRVGGAYTVAQAKPRRSPSLGFWVATAVRVDLVHEGFGFRLKPGEGPIRVRLVEV